MLQPDRTTLAVPGPRTTVAQLLWMQPPGFEFRQLVADMIEALSGSVSGRVSTDWDGDSAVLIDFDGSRVAMSFARDLARDVDAAMTVAIGYGPDGEVTRMADNQALLARLIVQRITSRHPALRVIWSHSQRLATRSMLTELDASLMRRETEVEPTRRSERARYFANADDLPRFFDQLETSLAERRRQAPAAEPDDEAEPLTRPQRNRLRLAAHLLDAVLMIVALPIGAAMMIWSIARGADVTTSARALAVCAVVIAGLHASGVLAPVASAISLAL